MEGGEPGRNRARSQRAERRVAACLMTSGRASVNEVKGGEPGRNRTFNQQIKSLLLCQLSYGPTLECEVGSAKCQVKPARRA